MKKLLIISALLVGVSFSSRADSLTWVVSNGAMSNLLTAPVRVTRLIYQSTTTNTALFSGIDTASATFTNIIGGFSVITQKKTNCITSYTDFFGKATLLTNACLISETNTTVSVTNTFPTVFTLGAGTNTQGQVDNANFFFVNGFTVTNSGAGPVSITATYQQ